MLCSWMVLSPGLAWTVSFVLSPPSAGAATVGNSPLGSLPPTISSPSVSSRR